MTRFLRPWAVLLSLGGLLALPAQAELKPQWELGVGLAALDFPLYRGAEDRRSYLLPVPYVQYHGDILQINRDRMRALFFHRGPVELDFSVNGSTPVSSNDSKARQGMPDIDPILEIGPSLNVHLYYNENKSRNLDLRLPLRAAYAVSFSHVEQQGWLFQPTLNLDWRLDGGWNLGLMGSLLYADQRYHQYFYDVAPQYATATRPAYSADAGYSGKQFITALSKRYSSYWIGGFVKWDDLSGASFADSPLVRSRQSFAVGFAVSWILSSSDKLVEVSND